MSQFIFLGCAKSLKKPYTNQICPLRCRSTSLRCGGSRVGGWVLILECKINTELTWKIATRSFATYVSPQMSDPKDEDPNASTSGMSVLHNMLQRL